MEANLTVLVIIVTIVEHLICTQDLAKDFCFCCLLNLLAHPVRC